MDVGHYWPLVICNLNEPIDDRLVLQSCLLHLFFFTMARFITFTIMLPCMYVRYTMVNLRHPDEFGIP